MSEQDDVETMGRLAWRTAGQLRMLREQMQALSWRPDGYEPADLGALADALHGMAMRCAMDTGNAGMLSEVSGREFRKVTGDDL